MVLPTNFCLQPEASLEVMLLDLSSLRSVKAFADEFITKGLLVNILVCNAGVFGGPFRYIVRCVCLKSPCIHAECGYHMSGDGACVCVCVYVYEAVSCTRTSICFDSIVPMHVVQVYLCNFVFSILV